jgi:hypothetical protein
MDETRSLNILSNQRFKQKNLLKTKRMKTKRLKTKRIKTKRIKTKRIKTKKRKTTKKINSKYFNGFLYSQSGGSKLRGELDRIVTKFAEVGSKNITLDGIQTIRESLLIINRELNKLKDTWEENKTSNDNLLDEYTYHLNNYKKLKVNNSYLGRIHGLIKTFLENNLFINDTSKRGGTNREIIYSDSFVDKSDPEILEYFSDKKFKFLILGGGPVGLFSAYILSINFPDSEILLVDNRILTEHTRQFSRNNILFKVPGIFLNPDRIQLDKINKENFNGDGNAIYKIEQKLTGLINKKNKISTLYSELDVIDLIFNDNINVDYVLNTTGGRLETLINDDNDYLRSLLTNNNEHNGYYLPLKPGLNKFVCSDETKNFNYNPTNFDTDINNDDIVYLDISKISNKLPSQIYITSKGVYFIKFDIGVSLLNTNTQQGDTLYYAAMQINELVNTLKELKS